VRSISRVPSNRALSSASGPSVDGLEDDGVTEAINRAIAGVPDDHRFTDAAAAAGAREGLRDALAGDVVDL